ncbi:MAG: hypothetical protein JJT88_14015 [Gammaproteobacteria bacterium]|nr:hypothetical protein [Gammaproteobacteria bacterium]
MKRKIAFAALLAAVVSPALAQEGQIIRMGDSALSCTDIILQANAAAETLGGAPEGGLMTGENAVAVAQTAALHTGMGQAIPGLGAVGGMFRQASQARQQQQEAARKVAQSRWYYLNGLYAGRQCDQVLAAEAAVPEAGAEEVMD